MARVNGVKDTVLARRAVRESRRVRVRKVRKISAGFGPEKELVGGNYPGELVLLVDGMSAYMQGKVLTHELIHNRRGRIGRSEKLTLRAEEVAFERMTKRQLLELYKSIPPDTES
ncbi:MAG TPA: hypothetical protein VEW42_04160 [Candidatus Eisenbacteria bacterium]|nr:hypothetical protein [Candidatus Eisenbacteria bacterium]